MDDKRVRIKYHQGYDEALNEKLTATAVARGGEFSDVPLGNGVREMSFEFERPDDLRTFFQEFKKLIAEKDEATSVQ
jgi:hypothetical protein